jgi:hypothetical protein
VALQLYRFVLGSAALALLLCAGGVAVAQQPPDCMGGFNVLLADYQKYGKAVEAANKRKANAQEACGLFKSLAAAQEKMLKYMKDNQFNCHVPDEAVKNLGASVAKTVQIKTQVCNVAANGGGQRPPSAGLSGAINITGEVGGPPPDSTSTGGLFDTLNGNLLQR